MTFSTTYTFNTQDDGDAIFFVIVKMVRSDTYAGLSEIKYKLDNMNTYPFKHDIPRANLQIAEWMKDIYFSGKTYSYIVRQLKPLLHLIMPTLQ